MAQLPRRDRYGALLPELAEASRQSLHDTPANQIQRRHIQAVLEETYRALLRRDMHAEVTVSFVVVQGRIQQDVRVGVVRQYRCQTEE